MTAIRPTTILRALTGAALLLACASTAPPAPSTGEGRLTLGVFDSRALTVAYVNSERFPTLMQGLQAELAAAQDAGDEARVAELEARGPELQARIHAQGFSTAPVDDILAHIADSIPGIAREAGVDAIVSRWHLVYRDPAAPVVDVTERLVAALEPDEDGLRAAREIVEQEPVPLDRLDHDH